MNKKSFKKMALGLLSASVILTLAACGNGSSSKKDAPADDKTLTVSVAKGYVDYVKDIKGDFEKENDIKIKVVEKDMFDQLEALSLDGPAGKAPDVMMSAYDRIGPLGQQGHIAEVKLGNEEQYDKTDKAQVTVDGKIFGEPAVIETLVFYYNKDLITEAPKTFKDVEELAKDPRFDFKGEAGKNTAFLAKWTDFYFSYGLLAGYGGYVFGDEGTNPKDIGLNNKGAVEGITYATKWFKDVWPKGMQDVKSADNFIAEQFTTGKTAAILGGPWAAQSYKEAKINYGVATIPTLDNGKNYKPFAGGKGWVISNYSKHKEVSQKWLDYVTNKDNQTKFYDATNEVPANQAAREVAKGKNDELTNAVIAQYANAEPMPNIPEMGEIWTGAENLMFEAAAGNKTPQESADASVKIIKEAIDQKYTK
ncbi:sugar ABC transporter substrate-binding protein [Carnobacterium divergens]|uniref:Maltodextrin-binding protein n=1 Tax=Carnobacterium divergens DSM 20623 TaxID=1449336 RepID=A0A0R2HXG5_CARDV|nr:extracellular solute-binding protein [Carnobacterium divergens]ANZ99519.1 sugar ABC transporter substrate-binding protein [Carnobacterium divergens]KRN57475.1 maltodextrin-binding protein MdxE [Carnobacterium divergens DSM 20623]MDO0875201.1 extracellular solute-binding protein [Carnobacterium divergens]MDT1995926.1 extracellular solute-binding protein [Carnobacterium divergens]MDT2011485.1 extracellular solute-binding protein [Carnobacterium divergens]